MHANPWEDIVGLLRPGGPTEKPIGCQVEQAGPPDKFLDGGSLGQVAFGVSCGGRIVLPCPHRMGSVKRCVGVSHESKVTPIKETDCVSCLVSRLNPGFEVCFLWRVFQAEEAPVEIALQLSAGLELHLLQAGFIL